ncbi:phosphatase PAP2 family protein [Micromonospora sp. PLK6-60]|uniref:phosphatase PAP2 family protein n=1 Tax=Micromonospora sp. PLK6-60 TaxID=2873383 RepID=UPI001CA63BE8|nr:phosphatase PAP2 family protein [Micromonospora sp. PLK6-60]MBY8872543.1 phosphatase PAP2 family protein [Micromonospora sp. PLK6-60]
MAVVTDPQRPVPSGSPDRADGGRRRVVAMAVWGAAFVACWLAIGLPTDPAYAFVWIWAATIAWNSARPWRSHLAFARDWVPVVLLLIVYNLSRGFADNGRVPHAMELIVADRFLVGWATGGEVPTVWLQQHLYEPQVQWYDVLVSWVYFSHFVVALAAAGVLWVRSRKRWGAYMRRWGFLCASGLVTYFIYPAAPPWWAAQNGLLTEVARISTRGWKAFGMHGAGNLLNAGQIASNPVAAMPSLHTAWALFVVVFFLPSVRRRWWPLLLAYPLAMTFTLVYAGEHYIIDVLVGWAYVGMAFLVVGLAERGWAAWRSRRGPAEPTPAQAAAAPDPGEPAPTGGAGAAPPATGAVPAGESSAGPARPSALGDPDEVPAPATR